MPDKKTITDELEALQLEEAREQAEERRTRRANRLRRREGMEESIKRDRDNQARIQAGCSHRKGGKGPGGMYQGNDQNYAVVQYTLSHGPTILVCTRCYKLWVPPEKPARNATAEQKAKYRADVEDYNRARNFPTDNEPGGTVLFTFTQPDPEALHA